VVLHLFTLEHFHGSVVPCGKYNKRRSGDGGGQSASFTEVLLYFAVLEKRVQAHVVT
jgi:hypothetical protein